MKKRSTNARLHSRTSRTKTTFTSKARLKQSMFKANERLYRELRLEQGYSF